MFHIHIRIPDGSTVAVSQPMSEIDARALGSKLNENFLLAQIALTVEIEEE